MVMFLYWHTCTNSFFFLNWLFQELWVALYCEFYCRTEFYMLEFPGRMIK